MFRKAAIFAVSAAMLTGQMTAFTCAAESMPESAVESIPESGAESAAEAVAAEENAYASENKGTWHGIAVETGAYSVYLPESLEQCVDGVMIAVPGGTTAEEFMDSETGQSWQATAEDFGIALAFVEPQDGGDWNIERSEDGRDDAAYMKAVSDNFHNKGTETAAFNLNERKFYVVGYDEGSIAAQEFAMTWPALICGAVSVNGYNVPSEQVTAIGDTPGYPFAEAGDLSGVEENNIPNKEIPVPMWLIDSEEAEANSEEVVNYWVSANQVEEGEANEYADTVYGAEDDPQRVWVTSAEMAADITTDDIYDGFLKDVNRNVGNPGGMLQMTVTYENDGSTGFFHHEEEIGGYLRKWYTFVPSSYDGSEAVPMVVAMHGYSSSIEAFTNDTHLQDVAEENGFIVVFAQAYPGIQFYGQCIAPVWRTYGLFNFTGEENLPDDVSFINEIMDITEEEYNIDTEREYAIGHSNGSGMTWALAQDLTTRFAAVAPSNLADGNSRGDTTLPSTPEEDSEALLPVWFWKTQYDVENGATLEGEEGASNLSAVENWTARNKTGAEPAEVIDSEDGRYHTSVYKYNDVPMFQFTVVDNAPHAYMIRTESEMIWNDFFSHFTRQADGTLCYDGEPVE